MYIPPPVKTLQEFEEILSHAKPFMSLPESASAAENAIDYIKEHGMPSPSTYAYNRLIIESEEDLNAKMHLAIAPLYKAYIIDNTLKDGEYFPLIGRITDAVNQFYIRTFIKGEEVEYPFTINLPPLLESI